EARRHWRTQPDARDCARAARPLIFGAARRGQRRERAGARTKMVRALRALGVPDALDVAPQPARAHRSNRCTGPALAPLPDQALGVHGIDPCSPERGRAAQLAWEQLVQQLAVQGARAIEGEICQGAVVTDSA